MESIAWSLPAVFEVLAAAAPDRDMLVWKDTRRTYAQVATRATNIAGFLQRRGIGARRERSELERWECGQATVALLLYNCPEYVESMLGCFRARAVPFNVNQHYRPEEVRSLLDMLSAEAIVYHRALGPLVGAATSARNRVLIDVDDGSGVPALAGSTSFEDAAGKSSAAESLPIPSPDDLYLVCSFVPKRRSTRTSCANSSRDRSRASRRRVRSPTARRSVAMPVARATISGRAAPPGRRWRLRRSR